MTRKEFAQYYGEAVKELAAGSGIIPALVISQAILESSGKVNGKYLPGQSKLSKEANNFFGIKANKSWKGDIYTIDTKEQTKDGKIYTIKANFRKYDNPIDSFRDYIVFLIENSRYTKAGLFNAKNVKDQAQALQRAGYATDTKYADLINNIYKSVKDYLPANFDKADPINPNILSLLEQKKKSPNLEPGYAKKNTDNYKFIIGLISLALALYFTNKGKK